MRLQRRVDRLIWEGVRLSRRADASRLSLARRRPAIVDGQCVSILIPTLPSRVELLRVRSLPSVVEQSHEDFEVLVITDAPDAGVERVTKDFGPRFKHLVVNTRGRRRPVGRAPIDGWFCGASPALNLGLRQASGAFIARLDDDDAWDSCHLATMLSALERRDVEFASSRARLPDGTVETVLRLSDAYFGPEADPSSQIEVGSPITWVYKSYLRFIRYSKQSWRKTHNRPVDLDLQLRLHRAGVRMHHVPTPTASIGLRDGLTTWGSEAFLDEFGEN